MFFQIPFCSLLLGNQNTAFIMELLSPDIETSRKESPSVTTCLCSVDLAVDSAAGGWRQRLILILEEATSFLRRRSWAHGSLKCELLEAEAGEKSVERRKAETEPGLIVPLCASHFARHFHLLTPFIPTNPTRPSPQVRCYHLRFRDNRNREKFSNVLIRYMAEAAGSLQAELSRGWWGGGWVDCKLWSLKGAK